MILFRNSWTDPRLLRVRTPGRGLWLPPGEGAAASGDLGPLCPPGKALPSNLKEPASSQCSLARRGLGRRLNAPGQALADPAPGNPAARTQAPPPAVSCRPLLPAQTRKSQLEAAHS